MKSAKRPKSLVIRSRGRDEGCQTKNWLFKGIVSVTSIDPREKMEMPDSQRIQLEPLSDQ